MTIDEELNLKVFESMYVAVKSVLDESVSEDVDPIAKMLVAQYHLLSRHLFEHLLKLDEPPNYEQFMRFMMLSYRECGDFVEKEVFGDKSTNRDYH